MSAGGAPHLLVSHADEPTARALASHLGAAGYSVEVVDPSAALARATAGGADVVLTGSARLCRALKGLGGEPAAPVILTVLATVDDARVEALAADADACVDEPIEETALLAAVDAALRLGRAQRALSEARAALERVANVCPMTGLFTLRYLRGRLPALFDAASARREPLACVMVDVDGLRAHNAAHGRAFGDSVIVEVARGVQRSLREGDVVVRYGADDLLALLPGTHFAGAMVCAERVFAELDAKAFATPRGARVTVHVSMGVAVYPGREIRTRGELLRATHAALADAKREGGRRVGVFRAGGVVLTRGA